MADKIKIPTPPQPEHLDVAQAIIADHAANADKRRLSSAANHLNQRAEQLERAGYHSEAERVALLGRLAVDSLEDI